MTLPANHDNALFACISAILEAEAAALNRRDEVLQTVTAILSVTQRAIASFAERWNASKAATLPVELLVNCFQHLRFNDRLLVSHVSQHWRHVALNTPLLWTDLEIGKANGKLEEMLRRSQPAPLSLRLYLTSFDETVLRPHFARIRDLKCANTPTKLDAPLLETLDIWGPYSRELVLSQDYVGSSAQSLRALHLRSFRIDPPSATFPHNLRTLHLRGFGTAPPSAVFPNLREFQAGFNKHTRLQDLLALCPSLESLTARCDSGLGKNPKALFVPLPGRLTAVTITGLQTDLAQDVLKPWLTHRFRLLEMGKLVSISSALNLFCASLPSSESPWRLEIRTEEHMSYVLSTDTDRTHLVGPDFAPDTAAAVLASIQRFRPPIAHLTDLRLSIQFLRIAVDMALELPAVTALAFVVVPEHNGKAPYDLFETPATSGMVVPQLRSLAFACHPSYAFGRPALEWFFRTLAYRLRDWVRYDAKTLDVISLEGKVSRTALKKVEYKHSFLYSHAREIRIDPSAVAD